MRAFYPAQADIATWLRPKGPILRGDVEAVEELFGGRRAPTPSLQRSTVEVATVAPQMRSSPSAPMLRPNACASPGVPGPAFHFVHPHELKAAAPSQVVGDWGSPCFLRGAPQQAAAPVQHAMFAQMPPGPSRQRSAPVLLGTPAAQAAAQNSGQGVAVKGPEADLRGAQPTFLTPGGPPFAVLQAPHPATSRRPAEGTMYPRQVVHFGGCTPPFAVSDSGGKGPVPCRQQSAPVTSQAQAQVTVVTAKSPVASPEGPWMAPEKEVVKEQPVLAPAPPPASRQEGGSPPRARGAAQAARQSPSPPATARRRSEAAKTSTKETRFNPFSTDAFARRHRRRTLISSCVAAWAAQSRACTRAKLTAALEQCRKLQEEVDEKAAAAKQAEVELMRRTEDEFKRLREVQAELLQLQQEAPALTNQVHSVPSLPRGHMKVAKLSFFAWRREARSRQRIWKLLNPSRTAQERSLLQICWASWQPVLQQRRSKAGVLKLANASFDREAKALLRHSFLAWHGQKALGRKSTAKGDVFTMGTAPLSAAIYQSAVIRPDATISPASTRPLEPKAATNGSREGDATPPPPPPPARRNSLPGQTKTTNGSMTAAERLQEAMVEIPSPVMPAARPGGVQWRAAVWPIADSSRAAGPFAAAGGEKVMLRLGQAK